MKPRYFPMLGALFALTGGGALLLPSVAPALSTEVESNEDVEVLTRGPVHEAFAESVSFEPQAGFIVASAPPALIEELPPEQKPDGDNVTWIPGYWSWDEDQSDFLWVSGIWRNLPPGRQWVPGYWDAIDGGQYQWTSGYWADSTTTEVAYIPTPPPVSVDVGPNIAAPSEDDTWVPGNWMWNEDRYAWRPGYWLPLRQNWTWVPSRYNWTRRGYVYVDGYWDYAVADRGVLFAPVYYRRHVYTDPDYYYTPSIVVSLNVFSSHLFVRPSCGHYYFGDYYSPIYRDRGFYSPFAWHRAHRGYDPIWAYDRWDHRHEKNWVSRRENDFNFFRDNDRFRPPHSWASMNALRGQDFADDRGRSRLFANSFASVVKNPARGQHFQNLDKESRAKFVTQRQEMRQFGQNRRLLEERRNDSAANGGDKKLAFREKLARSPIVGRQANQFAKNAAPPKRPEARGNKALFNGAGKADGQAAGKEAARNLAQREGKGAAAERKGDRGATAQNNTPRPDRKPAVPGAANRGDGQKQQARQQPGRKADGVAKPQQNPQRKAERQAQPKQQVRPTPQRKEQATPQRQAPKQQVAPQRKQQATPQRQVPKQQVAPQRKQQAAPQRQAPKQQVAPQRKQQAAPQRQPQRQQAAPQRKQQAAPQRQAPQRQQAAPQRKQQAAPQRQAPQRQAQAKPQARQQAPQAQKRQAQTQDRRKKAKGATN